MFWKRSQSKVDNAIELLRRVDFDRNSSCYKEHNMGRTHDLDIIIPCYNAEKYIRECLNSVINQRTDYNYRIILINDGSTDSTGVILQQYKEVSKIIIINQDNQGISAARNAGLDMVDAEYIMFVDSDDMLEKDAVEKLLKLAYKEKADIVEGGYIQFNEKRELDKIIHKTTGVLSAINKVNEPWGYPWGKVYKSDLWEKVGFPDYWYEDSVNREIIFWLADKIITVSDIVYKYRINPAGVSISGKGNVRCIDTLWIGMHLYKDRIQYYNLPTTEDYYDYKLKCARFLYFRTEKMSQEIKKACFLVYCKFMNEQFRQFSTNNKDYHKIEKAIRKENFKLYQKNFI